MSNRARVRTVASVAATVAAAVLAPPTPAAAQSACGGYYTIQTGDSLLEISERCGVTIPALLAVNPQVRDREDLVVGGRIAIPDPTAEQPSPQMACGGYYSVRTGDTLAEIAEKCGVTIPMLVAANPPLPHPLGVHEGVKVQIPDLPRAAVVSPTTFVAEPAAVPAPAAPAADEAATTAPALARYQGTLIRGDRCVLLRTGGGETVGLVGTLRAFGPGAEVVVLGVPARGSSCGTARAIEVRIAYSTRP